MYDIITDYIQPNFSTIQTEVTDIYESRRKTDNTEAKNRIAELTKQVNDKKQVKVNLAIKSASGIIDDSTYQAASMAIDAEIAEMVQEISKLSQFDSSSAEALAAYNRNIEQLSLVIDLKDDEINEAVYSRILDKIEVFNGNILKFYFKFLSKPVILKYKTVGRADGFNVLFTVLEE